MEDRTDEGKPRAALRVAFVTGVTPDKWARRWRERCPDLPLTLLPVEQVEQVSGLRSGDVDMAFVRLPVDREGLHLIPLWTERPVVVVSREHPVAAYDEIALADLADEHLLQDVDEHPLWRDVATEVRDGTRHPVPALTLPQVIESVAAQAGIALLPMSVARAHHRKDVVAVPVNGLEETQVGLAWPRDADDDRFERFIGIVRGRTERSSRGVDTPASGRPAVRPRKKPGTASRDRSGSSGGASSGRGARRSGTKRRRGR